MNAILCPIAHTFTPYPAPCVMRRIEADTCIENGWDLDDCWPPSGVRVIPNSQIDNESEYTRMEIDALEQRRREAEEWYL